MFRSPKERERQCQTWLLLPILQPVRLVAAVPSTFSRPTAARYLPSNRFGIYLLPLRATSGISVALATRSTRRNSICQAKQWLNIINGCLRLSELRASFPPLLANRQGNRGVESFPCATGRSEKVNTPCHSPKFPACRFHAVRAKQYVGTEGAPGGSSDRAPILYLSHP